MPFDTAGIEQLLQDIAAVLDRPLPPGPHFTAAAIAPREACDPATPQGAGTSDEGKHYTFCNPATPQSNDTSGEGNHSAFCTSEQPASRSSSTHFVSGGGKALPVNGAFQGDEAAAPHHEPCTSEQIDLVPVWWDDIEAAASADEPCASEQAQPAPLWWDNPLALDSAAGLAASLQISHTQMLRVSSVLSAGCPHSDIAPSTFGGIPQPGIAPDANAVDGAHDSWEHQDACSSGSPSRLHNTPSAPTATALEDAAFAQLRPATQQKLVASVVELREPRKGTRTNSLQLEASQAQPSLTWNGTPGVASPLQQEHMPQIEASQPQPLVTCDGVLRGGTGLVLQWQQDAETSAPSATPWASSAGRHASAAAPTAALHDGTPPALTFTAAAQTWQQQGHSQRHQQTPEGIQGPEIQSQLQRPCQPDICSKEGRQVLADIVNSRRDVATQPAGGSWGHPGNAGRKQLKRFVTGIATGEDEHQAFPDQIFSQVGPSASFHKLLLQDTLSSPLAPLPAPPPPPPLLPINVLLLINPRPQPAICSTHPTAMPA